MGLNSRVSYKDDYHTDLISCSGFNVWFWAVFSYGRDRGLVACAFHALLVQRC